MNFSISAYSTALFSTWINIEELNLLFDAGDGLTSGLMSKSRKIKNVFISHADRDHLGGLPQFVQLNAREEYPKIHYPKDCGSFPALSEFLGKFDPHSKGASWFGIVENQDVEIKKGILVRSFRNEHIKANPGVSKSLSYHVVESKRKLKSEFLTLSSNEIKALVDKYGRGYISSQQESILISYSGDTPVDDYSKYEHSKILIHECTFLNDAKENKIESRGNKHSKIEEVFKMVSELNIEKLILSHFSSRYGQSEIDKSVLSMSQKYNIKIPIYLIYPGQIHRDILKANPINS